MKGTAVVIDSNFRQLVMPMVHGTQECAGQDYELEG